MIANRLLQLEAKLAEEETGTSGEPASPTISRAVGAVLRPVLRDKSERFSESAYETRSALSELVGCAVRLMPKGGMQELDGELCVGHNDGLSVNACEPDSNLRASLSISD
jgi:hypothetical protein